MRNCSNSRLRSMRRILPKIPMIALLFLVLPASSCNSRGRNLDKSIGFGNVLIANISMSDTVDFQSSTHVFVSFCELESHVENAAKTCGIAREDLLIFGSKNAVSIDEGRLDMLCVNPIGFSFKGQFIMVAGFSGIEEYKLKHRDQLNPDEWISIDRVLKDSCCAPN